VITIVITMFVAPVADPAAAPHSGNAARWSWVLLGALVAGAWVVVIIAGQHSHDSVEPLTWAAGWLVMILAMMVPTLVPMLRTLSSLLAGRQQATWWHFVGGYVLSWIAAGGVAMALSSVALVLDPVSRGWATVAGLALAGVYQFTPLKAKCLRECTSPFLWFLRNWRDGARGAWVMGTRHAASCLGCCWALMALSVIAVGAGIVGMVAMTVVMVVEKVPSLGRALRVPLGGSLIAVAVVLAVAQVGGDGDTPHRHEHSIHSDG
jgi:predicted metal-binding membrane protein